MYLPVGMSYETIRVGIGHNSDKSWIFPSQ